VKWAATSTAQLIGQYFFDESVNHMAYLNMLELREPARILQQEGAPADHAVSVPAMFQQYTQWTTDWTSI
jgi:hypothetical protein